MIRLVFEKGRFSKELLKLTQIEFEIHFEIILFINQGFWKTGLTTS